MRSLGGAFGERGRYRVFVACEDDSGEMHWVRTLTRGNEVEHVIDGFGKMVETAEHGLAYVLINTERVPA